MYSLWAIDSLSDPIYKSFLYDFYKYGYNVVHTKCVFEYNKL